MRLRFSLGLRGIIASIGVGMAAWWLLAFIITDDKDIANILKFVAAAAALGAIVFGFILLVFEESQATVLPEP